MFGADAAAATPHVASAPQWLRVELGAAAPLAVDPTAREWSLTVHANPDLTNPATRNAEGSPTVKPSDITPTSNQNVASPPNDAITIETGNTETPQLTIHVRRIAAK
jgi:hypothetical protein